MEISNDERTEYRIYRIYNYFRPFLIQKQKNQTVTTRQQETISKNGAIFLIEYG